MECRFCNSKVDLYLDMSYIPISVTSDGQVIDTGIVLYKCSECGLIQKDATVQSQNEYFQSSYSQSLLNGKEQMKFVDGVAFPKSELIISGVKESINNPKSMLDIGTGSGAFLSAFKKVFPLCEIYGQDIQENFIENILKYIPKENFYCKDIGEINQKFNLISMVGVLSHIPLLLKFLDDLYKISNEDGQILIHTNDFPNNFFDVVIIDCITHISKPIMYKMLSKYYKNISFFNTIYKEVTVGINLVKNQNHINFEDEEIFLNKQKEIFKNFIDFIYNSKNSYSVLGSSPSSIYIGAILKERLIDFVDEDIDRVGRVHLNREIKSFQNTSEDNIIILPFLQKNIIESIKSKHPNIVFLTYLNI